MGLGVFCCWWQILAIAHSSVDCTRVGEKNTFLENLLFHSFKGAESHLSLNEIPIPAPGYQ